MGQEVATQLVLAVVTSRLDCCNEALASLPQAAGAPLQWTQNSAAHLIFEPSTREHANATVALATSMLVRPVQTVLRHAFHLAWNVSTVQHICQTLFSPLARAAHVPDYDPS